MANKVYIVGAGPGDSGLITVKGWRFLQKADVILYDELVNENILLDAKKSAKKVYVGKKYRYKSTHQEKIHSLIKYYWSLGMEIVRLKGGDSTIFARLSEEVSFLEENGIPYEVVPGVTTASTLIYSGIPLTDRESASRILFLTGRKKDGSIVDIGEVTPDTTIVFYMGYYVIGELQKKLLGKLPPDTPSAVIINASTGRQKKYITTVSNLSETAAGITDRGPKIIVVGETVRKGAKKSWFEKKPLFGKKFVLSGTQKELQEIVPALEAEGAEVNATVDDEQEIISNPAIETAGGTS